MASNPTIALDEIAIPEELAANVEDNGVVYRIRDPLRKDLELEEVVLLAHHVQLRVAIQEARRDELIQDTKGQGWENGVEDVVEG